MPARLRDEVRVTVTWSVPHPEMQGRDLDAIAAEWGCTRREAAERLLPAGAIYYQMNEEDVRRIIAHPRAMIGSDGLPHDAFPTPASGAPSACSATTRANSASSRWRRPCAR